MVWNESDGSNFNSKGGKNKILVEKKKLEMPAMPQKRKPDLHEKKNPTKNSWPKKTKQANDSS